MSPENHPPNKDIFACRNGDGLIDLNARKASAQKRLEVCRRELREAQERILAPLEDGVRIAESEVQNLSCRLNIWWNEFRAAGGKDQ